MDRPPNPARLFLEQVARELREAERLGAATDEPEGSRYIQMSDSWADSVADELEQAGQLTDVLNYSDENLHRFAVILTSEIRRRQTAVQEPLIVVGRG